MAPGQTARRVVAIRTPAIPLGALLKWAGVAATGGQAKEMIRRGLVRVNGKVERRRGRQILPGDVVQVGTRTLEVRRAAGDADAPAAC